MSRRPTLLFHCQHSLGLGHLVRSYAVAGELARDFDVTLVSGGEEPLGIRAPAGVQIVQLPALAADVDGRMRTSAGDVPEVLERRSRLLLASFAELSPAALVIELFPFGRKKLGQELFPLLEVARDTNCRVVCSVRDILVDRGRRQPEHDERAALVLNTFFDAVLVHADPSVARLEESFRPRTALQVPVYYTGFVVPPNLPPRRPPASAWRLVVSAGGGAYGEELLATAVRTRPLLPADVEMRVIAGPFATDESWDRLRVAAAEVGGVELLRSVPDLAAELAQASASLSQCGYNTALALARASLPALVVPFGCGEENEQRRRAERLASLGALHVLDPELLEPGRLARSLETLKGFRPTPLDVSFEGARTSARIVADLVGSDRQRSAGRGDWLEPLRRVLAERDSPIGFFFRDDDAGWETASLLRLLDLFGSRGVPLDLAVIPAALDVELAYELLRRAHVAGNLRVHQHGLAHVNHEPTGRRCEFGPARSREEQRADLMAGRERLNELLGSLTDPIFTPPWNRCTATTASCLDELGYRALSREAKADSLAADHLAELPVSVDWFGRKRVRRTRAEIVLAAAAAAGGDRPVGVMLHHGDLDDGGRSDTSALLDVLLHEHTALLTAMRDLTAGDDAGRPTEIQTARSSVGQEGIA